MAPLEFTYRKQRDGREAGRRKEYDRETERECGIRVGPFEMGYRAETRTRKTDERRREVAENVRRVMRLGFAQPQPAYAHAA